MLRNRPLSVWWKSLSGVFVELILTDTFFEYFWRIIRQNFPNVGAHFRENVFQSRPLVERWDKIFFSVGKVTFEKNSRVRFPNFGCTKVLVTVTRVRKKIPEALRFFFELLDIWRLESGDVQKNIGRIQNIFFRASSRDFWCSGLCTFYASKHVDRENDVGRFLNTFWESRFGIFEKLPSQ